MERPFWESGWWGLSSAPVIRYACAYEESGSLATSKARAGYNWRQPVQRHKRGIAGDSPFKGTKGEQYVGGDASCSPKGGMVALGVCIKSLVYRKARHRLGDIEFGRGFFI